MKVLLLGNSSLVRRRVLPALARLGVRDIDVASVSRGADVALPPGATGRRYDDYRAALERSDAALVYVSTVNSTHEELAEGALDRGFHVVVDKPACLSVEASRRLVRLARQRGRCLAEATVYGYHPLYREVRRIFSEAGRSPTRLTATFSFPPLHPDNYRYRAALGGGSLLDLGPYAVTPGRLLFGSAEPASIACRVVERAGEVDASFSVLMGFPGGRSLVGHYGMTTGYQNRLDVLGPDVVVSIDRAFSPPADLPIQLGVLERDRRRTVEVPAADSFAEFFRAVFEAIERGDHDGLAGDLLADAILLEALRRAAS
ncbi:oxidoreductase [Sorangium cellulosum]|uniref:Oxidoreductase n=1 Tax=Sorangium cellulosum TaxID=56 RepID=A0A2L0EYM0_SORCE|nr:Gfo/Idh/MocA family oxidoreductase [Sorangium cellulosum]AUX44414.1 oxidoreductase [Sorangium cellulosum]